MKKAFFAFAVFLIAFVVTESIWRIAIGKRLVMVFEENGLNYFEPGQEGWYILRYPSARINNIGARGPDVEADSIRETPKTVFLGDSFTFGWLLKDEETIPRAFFASSPGLNPGEVLNYGNGGFGPAHMRMFYEKQSRFFSERDRVIVILPKIDFYRPLVPAPKNRVKEIFWKIRKKSALIAWSYAVFKQAIWIPSLRASREAPIEKKELTPAVLEEQLPDFARLLAGRHQQVVFVFFEFMPSRYAETARAFCRRHRLACITDIGEIGADLARRGAVLYAEDNAHPSAEMNRRVGRRIAQFVRENRD